MPPLFPSLALSSILISIGIYGMLSRKNLVALLLATEIIFLGITLLFASIASQIATVDGVTLVLCIMAIIACETVLLLGFILHAARSGHATTVDSFNDLADQGELHEMPLLIASWLICFPLVLASACLLAGLLRRSQWVADTLVLASIMGQTLIAGAAITLIAVFQSAANTPHLFSWRWLDVQTLELAWGVMIDPTGVVLACTVALVGLAVGLFSSWYMAQQSPGEVLRFYGLLHLFIAAMMGLIFAPNLLQFFLCWEVMGACSFLLIGFWYEEPLPSWAAKKALLMTRVGDVFLLFGILAIGGFYKSLDFGIIASHSQVLAKSLEEMHSEVQVFLMLTAACCLIGAMSKSAQFPLHGWLPDAMAGPTPASSLIHAATMVAAGIVLFLRLGDFFALSPAILLIAQCVAACSIVLGGFMACFQDDIKKVLAYSTISQLGYMLLAASLGNSDAGLFHLMTHAYFKALLFLGAGGLIHILHVQQMTALGRIGKKLPFVTASFLIGAGALVGIPPLSGFWSKEAVIATAVTPFPGETVSFGAIAYAVHGFAVFAALMGVALTAYYVMRKCLLVFWGSIDSHHEHECPLTWPARAALVLLATGATLAGFVETPLFPALTTFLHGNHEAAPHGGSIGLILGAQLLVLAGAGLSWWHYRGGGGKKDPAFWQHMRVLEKSYSPDLLAKTYWLPLWKASLASLQSLETNIVDGSIRFLWHQQYESAKTLHQLDTQALDAVSPLSTTLVKALGSQETTLHRDGQLQWYGMVMVGGVVVGLCCMLVAIAVAI